MKPSPQQPSGRQKSIGVHMKCCRVYVYANLNAAGDAFVAWCPKCAKQVRINVVAKGGSTSRFFEAS